MLRADDPREAEHRAAQTEAEAIRGELGALRNRLEELGRIEALMPMDSVAADVASTLSVSIMALYTLVTGPRSFQTRAERARDLWADVAADPDGYVVEPGTSRDAMQRR